MKGFRFYQEFETPKDKRKNQPTGNVFAMFTDRESMHLTANGWMVEGLGALFFHPNSAVCLTSAHTDYVRNNTKRISETKARGIHPELFKRLDEPDE